MSKSILVIDTPECCAECPMIRHEIDCITEDYCIKNGREIIRLGKKPNWCPLKEIPEKYYPVSMNFECGWNSCIDEILKERDENETN